MKKVYLNQKFNKKELDATHFDSLSSLAAALEDGSTVYISPGVYWTDDYKDPTPANTPEHPQLVGITFKQQNISFIGVTKVASDVVIAGNRGHTLGSRGNWSVIGLSSGFKAENITFGNYCNFDLVYERDPMQNVEKRSSNLVQAQTICGNGDRYCFINCSFVGFLNLMADFEPKRAYFKDCTFQLTNNAIANGATNVFENCVFNIYGTYLSNHGSSDICAFFGCSFVNQDKRFKTLYFSKSGGAWALIDVDFNGGYKNIEWEFAPTGKNINYLHNVTLNKKEVHVSKSNPFISTILNANTLVAYKNNKEYNSLNLLAGEDNWNPNNIVSNVIYPYKSIFEVNYEGNCIEIKAVITRNNNEKFNFIYDINLLEEVAKTNSSITLKQLHNFLLKPVSIPIEAISNNIVMSTSVIVSPSSSFVPTFLKPPVIKYKANFLILSYKLSNSKLVDASNITWYRSKTNKLDDATVVASSKVTSAQAYRLSMADVNYYIIASISPKYEHHKNGELQEVYYNNLISASQVGKLIDPDFSTIEIFKTTDYQDNNWYMKVAKMPESFEIDELDVHEDAFTYKQGTSYAHLGVYGLIATSQFGHLFYYKKYARDMKLVLNLLPNKTGSQGFGAAPQYLDVFFKYDFESKCGYALRIKRITANVAADKSVQCSLIKLVNNKSILISQRQLTSAFVGNCTITIETKSHLVKATLTSDKKQTDVQKDLKLLTKIEFSTSIAENSFGSCGLYFAGTTGANSILVKNFKISYN
ncbi:MAG: hypothetical protein LBV55_03830 [Acholeplasmatales bacterium]|jgi:hypothetical protein|nr:hypothetical protein [Acholeplasmatales bacterium]